MLIHDLDYSEKIYSESRVFGEKSSVYRSTKIRKCKATPNGKGLVCETSYSTYTSGDGKAPSPDLINEYIKQVEDSISIQAKSLTSLWSAFF